MGCKADALIFLDHVLLLFRDSSMLFRRNEIFRRHLFLFRYHQNNLSKAKSPHARAVPFS